MNDARTPEIITGDSDDEYYLTAHQIFECCGTSTVRVDTLMDKFAPFVKTNKAEFIFLKTLLDPEQCNPEIDVLKLANALHQYKEGQRKMDLDESFNLRCGQMPQDSDSGISTDGLQILEELQCELKEKDHLAQQLRSQLDFTDRQNEETVAALTAERDSLKRHLNVLREENATLFHVRREYEECCERLAGSSAALEEAQRELDVLRRRYDRSHDQRAALIAEKQSLHELLSKSKDECHRINEMYAARQSAMLEQNEKLKHEHAELSAAHQDQEELMTQLIKEKAILEMEVKDLLNKSNQMHLGFDRSIDVSYTDDQMLTALDNLNADSRFCSENRVLDEDSFFKALKEDHGRVTNLSLFDEIRMSLNVSRLNLTGCNTTNIERDLDSSLVTTASQTDKLITYDNIHSINAIATQTDENKVIIKKRTTESISIETQTDKNRSCSNVIKSVINVTTQTCVRVKDDYTQMDVNKNCLEATTQTDTFIYSGERNDIISIATQTDRNISSTATSTQTCENGLYGDEINSIINIATQTDQSNEGLSFENKMYVTSITKLIDIEPNVDYNKDMNMVSVETQTNEKQSSLNDNKVYVGVDFEVQTDFVNNEIEKTDFEAQTDIQECVPYCGGDNAQNYMNNRQESNSQTSIRPYYKETNNNVNVIDAEIQTETAKSGNSVQDNIQFFNAKYYLSKATQTVGEFIRKKPKFIKKAQQLLKLQEKKAIVKATVKNEPGSNNNNVHNKCLVCIEMNTQTNKSESDVDYFSVVKEMEDKLSEYENNLSTLEAVIGQGTENNVRLQGLVEDLRSKIEILETACEMQREIINKFTSAETCCMQSQTDFVQSSVSTQADVPCPTCEHRLVSHRGMRRFLWEPLKCLFQVFAVVCFLGAITILYGVSQRGRVRCDRARQPTPWRWFDAQDIMDLLLRIEYTAEVPM